MVFSSIPVYLDPPNWQQQQNQHHQANGSDGHQLLPPLLQQPSANHMGGIDDDTGAVTSDPLSDRTLKAPQVGTLKCPRCDSTNTKFCYFNNYSLSQPRHFCKTCRRYWTRGGALRNVPVGGGCRRNKKSKRSRSKSPISSEKPSLPNSTSAIPELIGRFSQPFVASLQNMSRYGVGNINTGVGLREIQAQNMGFQIGGHGHGHGNGNASSITSAGGGLEQWRFQQFPFMNGFESTSNVASYPFQSENVEGFVGDIAQTSRVTQLPPRVKPEYNGGLNLSRSPLDVSENSNHYYSWTDLSGLSSSSATHLL